jgi:hypothetical protein
MTFVFLLVFMLVVTGVFATNAAEIVVSYITPVQEDALTDTIFAWDITAAKGSCWN